MPVAVPSPPTARAETPVVIFSVPATLTWPSGDVETVGPEWLDEVVANWNNFQAKGDPRFGKPSAYLIPHATYSVGHEVDSSIAQQYANRSDLPAVGWPDRIWREGNLLFATLKGVPVKLAAWINAGAYKHVSAEFHRDYQGFGPCLRRVSILGAMPPERKDLGELPLMVFDTEQERDAQPLAFCERLGEFSSTHKTFGLKFGPELVVFQESYGGPKVTPQQQAVMSILSGLGVNADPATLDAIIAACQQAAPTQQMDQTDPSKLVAKQAEGMTDDPEYKETNDIANQGECGKKPDVAMNSEQLNAIIAKAVAKAVRPLRAKSDRAEVVAFCEQHKAKIYPFELDAKVGPTIVDRLLALSDDEVVKFGEGATAKQMTPRQAEMAAIVNRPEIAKFAEQMGQDRPGLDTSAEATKARLLKATDYGKKALKMGVVDTK